MSNVQTLDARLAVRLPELPAPPFTLTGVGGLRAAGVAAGIKASGKPDVALLVADAAVPAAAIFTQNLLCAAPVRLCRDHLAASGGLVRAIVVNSGNANACTGGQGMSDAYEMCARVAASLSCPVEQVLVCSTGVIGVKLPMDKVRAGIDSCLASLGGDDAAGSRFLAAIQTTDAFPKQAAEQLPGGGARIAGVCKGAGMIHPNMATMLAFAATDAALSSEQLTAALPQLAAQSFNAVHVDSHPSTNDTFIVLATGASSAPADAAAVFGGLQRVCHRLAWLIARDGEGATKVTTIEVLGCKDDATARAVANHVAISALVRTALYGNDPNWGRFTSQAANCPAVSDAGKLTCKLQGITVFAAGEPAVFDRAAAARAMAAEDVLLQLDFGQGPGHAIMMTSDLGYKYVEINAEYTT